MYVIILNTPNIIPTMGDRVAIRMKTRQYVKLHAQRAYRSSVDELRLAQEPVIYLRWQTTPFYSMIGASLSNKGLYDGV